MIKLSAVLGAMTLLTLVPTAAHASTDASAAAVQANCPDQHLAASDLVASRAAGQPNGASQAGSPWMPVDALFLRTSAQRRDFMLRSIREQLAGRRSTFNLPQLDRVLRVMRKIEREEFLPPEQQAAAYLPVSLDIGFCQTLSDAYIIALMTAAAQVGPHSNVLDVGTGSGYQAAILSRLAGHVQSLEIVPQLATQAGDRLKRMGYRNVDVAAADGYAGWPQRAPFDAIIVTAGATAIPQPLLDQLKPGGRLLMPIGPTALSEEVMLVRKSPSGALTQCSLGLASFVPLTGHARAAEPISAATPAKRLPRCYAQPVT